MRNVDCEDKDSEEKCRHISGEKKPMNYTGQTAAKIELVAGETPQVSPWIFGNQELFRSSRLNLRETGNLCQG